MRSMTGFCEKMFEYRTFVLKFQLKSLNHRYLDIIMRTSPFLFPLEQELREMVRERIKRGKVEVNAYIKFTSPEKSRIFINYPVLWEIVNSLRPFSQAAVINIDSLLKLPGIMELAFNEEGFTPEERDFILESFAQVLSCLIESKEKEGKKLRAELERESNRIEELVVEIEKRAPHQKKLIYQSLNQRLQQLLRERVDEQRLIQEAAFLAERADITEEVARIKAHLAELRSCFGKDGDLGRKLDFLCQELLREANTINSKSADTEISKLGVELKLSVEKIRQQVQNIE